MFTVGSCATTPSLLLFHLSQHFSFRVKKTEEEKSLEWKVLAFLSYKPKKNRCLLVNFLEKYYFLQNGVQ